MKFGVLFPGQGSQSVGMGKELYDKFESARGIFDRADEILGFPLSELCFSGPREELTLTHNAQPAIYVMSIASYLAFQEKNPSLLPAAAAGLSLGEFTAVTVSGAMSFEDGIQLVRKRGLFMQEAAEHNPGTMASILGLDYDTVSSICEEISSEHLVKVANVNTPSQLVISGSSEGVETAMNTAKEKGARRVIELQVSGAFHSPMMAEAQKKLANEIETLNLKTPKIPVVFNVNGKNSTNIDEIKKSMVLQVTNSVLWTTVMQTLIEKFALKHFLEVGCGTVLKGLARKIDPEIVVSTVNSSETIQEAGKALSTKL